MVQSGRKDSALQFADRLESEGQASQDASRHRNGAADPRRGPVVGWRRVTRLRSGQRSARTVDDERQRLCSLSGLRCPSASLPVAGPLRRGAEQPAGRVLARRRRARPLPPRQRALPAFRARPLSQAGGKANDESVAAFSESRLAGSAWGMAQRQDGRVGDARSARIAPKEELSTMQEALAIARNAKSDVLESYALINLSDIYLRRKDYRTTYDLSERSLKLAQQQDDMSLIAVEQGQHGLRAIWTRAHRSRQAAGGGSPGRVRTPGRARGDRRHTGRLRPVPCESRATTRAPWRCATGSSG